MQWIKELLTPSNPAVPVGLQLDMAFFMGVKFVNFDAHESAVLQVKSLGHHRWDGQLIMIAGWVVLDRDGP